ncbi:FAD-binding domain-containing protein [Aspergillus cavernicola]|uniref:FAD-binding domain-containing protein n=1 Tax=Aspergillus cavernicola TaxID=176166 RepID=A0ABR4HXR9_9EURO
MLFSRDLVILAALVGVAYPIPLEAQGQCGIEAQAQCCASLRETAVADLVFTYGDSEYLEAKRSYYSVTTSLNSPCIVLAESAADVSTVVKTLTQPELAPNCPFAIRSGGHSMVRGNSDIAAGVTIDLSRMNATVFHPETETASIGPGARWQSVYETLEPFGVAVSGGRLGSVGVGGFLTGGGITVHSAQRGWACDDVVAFEVVLANGTITRATQEINADLFHVLKGGSSNLAIVTNFEVNAFAQGDMWGGYAVYDNSSTPQLARSLANFTDNIEQDPRALLVTFWTYDSRVGVNNAQNALYYTAPDEYPSAYGDFYAIPNVSSTARTTDLLRIVTELPDYTALFRVHFITLTFYNDARIVEYGVRLYNDLLENIKSNVSGGDWVIIAGFQPLPTLFATSGLSKGGNILGLEREEDNQIVLLLEAFWQHVADDDLFYGLANSLIQDLDDYARSLGLNSEWLYLNYAGRYQDPLRGYGPENMQRLQQVASLYDPTGVFQTQVPGGFKISAAIASGETR